MEPTVNAQGVFTNNAQGQSFSLTPSREGRSLVLGSAIKYNAEKSSANQSKDYLEQGMTYALIESYTPISSVWGKWCVDGEE